MDKTIITRFGLVVLLAAGMGTTIYKMQKGSAYYDASPQSAQLVASLEFGSPDGGRTRF